MASPELSLFLHRVRDLIRRAPVTCGHDAPAIEIAGTLSREGVGSIVVIGADGLPLGIVTDRDLRRKVVGEGRDPAATTAQAIMSTPLVTTRPDAFAFEAVLEMTRRGIHHLVVLEDDRLVGVVSSHDILLLQTTHPVTLAREIDQAESIDALAILAGRVTALVRRLVEEGGTAHDVGQIVAELNDRLVGRVLDLAMADLRTDGSPVPAVAFCWLAFGSEARREQTLRTDQDNGLVYADPPADCREAAAGYFGRLADRVGHGLVQVGFPPCPGDIMATNPTWCQPLSVWTGYFRRWMREGTPQQILDAAIFFDLRPLAGEVSLGAALRGLIREEAPTHRRFLGLLARDVVDRRAPLTVFGNVAVARSGPRRGAVDVKGAGSLQLVGAARLHALELGLDETNTVARFQAAVAGGIYPEELGREITDAYQHLTRLRLVHQLARLASGVPPDNDINPRRLSHADLLLFRDALRTVTRVQAGIRERYATDFLL